MWSIIMSPYFLLLLFLMTSSQTQARRSVPMTNLLNIQILLSADHHPYVRTRFIAAKALLMVTRSHAVSQASKQQNWMRFGSIVQIGMLAS